MKVRNPVLLGVLLLLFPIMARAQFTVTTNNGAFVITGYMGPGGAVTIPGTSNGLPVIIGDYAFYGQTTLTNLTLLDGIENIGSNAFNSCTSLTSVAIPGSVTNIGESAFNYCTSLGNVVISNGVVNIGDSAFQSDSMASIAIPESVTNIGPSAFGFCESLASVTISNGVQSIGDDAFFNDWLIPNAVIPASVTSFGEGVFTLCTSMTNIEVDAANPNYASAGGVLFNKSLDTLVECPNHPYGSSSYVIPDGVTTIGPQAFALDFITNMIISNGVVNIGDDAIEGCHMPSVTIPSSVTNIGSQAFGECLYLTNITVDPANPNYASAGGVLFDKNLDTLIQYPCRKIGNYVISNSVSTVASNAFEDGFLTGVTIPNSVTNIGAWAFAYSSIADVTIPGSVGSISSDAFLNSPLTNVTILNGVTNIDSWAFFASYSLRTVTIPASVKSIGSFAFDSCTVLTNIYCLGDAPTADATVFSGDPGTIDYLPGATGWTNTLGGLPTAAWYPAILNNGAGVLTNRFGFTISWAANLSVVVEASTNFINWQPVQTNTLVSGSAYFSDAQWTNYPCRFYRLHAQ